MNVEQARFNMIEQQVRPWLVSDTHVLALLESVKREAFCPPEHRALAFMDMEIPLPCGQVMLTPRVQARLVQDLQLKAHDKVLQIGAGSGYMTALLSQCAQSVVAFEIHPELAEMARTNLQRAGCHADVRAGCGIQGAQATGPFDVIVLCGSVASAPASLLNQLKINGRLMAVLGNTPMMHATVITREGENTFNSRQLWDVVIPRLQGVPETPHFAF